MRALLMVVIAACTQPPLVEVPTDEAGEPLPSAGTATLRAGTIVLPASMTRDAALELTAVVFPAAGNDALSDLVRGNIIVSGTGDGFIRRVYSVTGAGDQIRVITSPATLADAVLDASFHMTTREPFTFTQRIDASVNTLTATIDGDLS
ncbi:MAG: hypothetical protein H0T65_18660, partial [Deltaproteobacteria bacterium]|nr:hypothetical protein [Deltaproteobacteria bacterium]